MQELIDYLNQHLSQKLPGRNAQLKMAPDPKDGGSKRKMEPESQVHKSSVLALLFQNKDGQTEIILTLRSSNINHGGQISFPGGRAEQGESPPETALREAQEEIGIVPKDVTILGELSELYVSPSKNRVLPVVGYLKTPPQFTINPKEVDEVFTITLEALVNKKNLTVEDWELGKHTYKVPYWNVHRVPLWGATAMMLNEFLDLYRAFKNTDKL